MSVKAILMNLFLMCMVVKSEGQVSKNMDDFIQFSSGKLNFDKFKDSTAVYTCKLQFIFDRKNPSNTIVTANDSTVSKNITGLDFLKEFDFQPLMGNHRKVLFNLPIAVLVSSSLSGKQTIDLNIIADKIRMLYYDNSKKKENLPTVQLFPLITTLDKKAYD